MHEKTNKALSQLAEFAGDLTSLANQIGSPDLGSWREIVAQSAASQIRKLPELREFLHAYCDQMLRARELPVICRAYSHAFRSEVRELIALDASLGNESAPVPFARASQHVGRCQLRRLRPLRDQRLVRRYLAAVQAGEAQAWHPVVFGLVIALYSLPLRQGMIHYATQTMNGFVLSASGPLNLRQAQCDELLSELDAKIPALVADALRATYTTPHLIPA